MARSSDWNLFKNDVFHKSLPFRKVTHVDVISGVGAGSSIFQFPCCNLMLQGHGVGSGFQPGSIFRVYRCERGKVLRRAQYSFRKYVSRNNAIRWAFFNSYPRLIMMDTKKFGWTGQSRILSLPLPKTTAFWSIMPTSQAQPDAPSSARRKHSMPAR